MLPYQIKKKLIESLGYKLKTLKYLFLKVINTVCLLSKVRPRFISLENCLLILLM